MRGQTIAALLAGLLLAPGARADFVVVGQRPDVAPPSPVDRRPPAAGIPDSREQATTASPGTPHRAYPRFNIAQGFGDQVPLRFAVRQIVPEFVKVTFGPGVDPDATVDWQGGQGWNRVLFQAVRPLGLRLVMTPMAVEIRQ
jgi:hypothetical protein